MNTKPKMTAEQAKDASRKSGKPFCKVCFDAGKEYTSHYLRSEPGPDGKLVCPTLLNQSCLTCGQMGHTSSYCGKRTTTTMATTKSMTTKSMTTKSMTTKSMTAHYNPKNNAFGALTDDMNDNDDNDNHANHAKPQTMAERLKSGPPNVKPPNVQPPPKLQPPSKTLPDMPPRSQFWWQDEDD